MSNYNQKASNFTPIATSGLDNLCGFNGIILGLTEPIILNGKTTTVLDEVERDLEANLKKLNLAKIFQNHFIVKVAEKLKIQEPTFAAVKQGLQELRKKDAMDLQKQIAPVLLELSIQIQKANKKKYIQDTYDYLLSAFQIFAFEAKGLHIGGGRDDVFIEHPFAKVKFTQLSKEFANKITSIDSAEYNRLKKTPKDTKFTELETQINNALDEQQDKLKTWWENEGYQTFLQEMERGGKMTSNIEHKPIAECFGFNLDYYLRDNSDDVSPTRVHHHCGSISLKLIEPQKTQLIVREIIQPPLKDSSEAYLLSHTQEEVEAGLNEIPECVEVTKFIVDNNASLEGVSVPDWSKNCKDALLKRNVIKDNKFIVNSEVAIDRILAVDGKDKIQQAWKENYKESPMIAIQFNSAQKHYSYMQPKTVSAVQAVPYEILYKATLNFFSVENDPKKAVYKPEVLKDLEEQAKAYDNSPEKEQIKSDQELAINLQLTYYEEYLRSKP